LAAVVIHFSQSGLRQARDRFVLCRAVACKHAILTHLKAVNPDGCALQYNKPFGIDPSQKIIPIVLPTKLAKGQKSYWGGFHGDVTLFSSP
jgi:hypothetical protein